jgi:hypothetical protein
MSYLLIRILLRIRRVRWMKVEVHHPNPIAAMVAAMQRLGVEAYVDPA